MKRSQFSLCLWFLQLVAVLLLVSCSSMGNRYVDGSGERSGALLFEGKCSECHGRYAPENYSDDEWKTIMKTMAREAKLSPQDHELILTYLQEVND